MSDKDLIDLVATIWVDNGGDVDSFDFCYSQLKQAILEKQKSNEL